MEISRNKKHELIMHAIFIALTYIDMKEEIDVSKAMEDAFDIPFNDIDLFSKGMVIKSLSNIDKIINIYSQYLKNWKWNRLAHITQAILLMSYTHFHLMKEKVDKAVVINIAIRLAKKYLDVNDYKFINGILDKVL